MGKSNYLGYPAKADFKVKAIPNKLATSCDETFSCYTVLVQVYILDFRRCAYVGFVAYF